VCASRGQPPRTPREACLAKIFADVLELESVGIHDNFFDLGGDSLRSMELASRARAAGLAMTSRDVFRHPSVAALADVSSAVAGPR
jgi:aryl carrier-like protein